MPTSKGFQSVILPGPNHFNHFREKIVNKLKKTKDGHSPVFCMDLRSHRCASPTLTTAFSVLPSPLAGT